MQSVYEAFFTLKHYGGWSLYELYNLPVGLRKWFVDRLLRQLEAEKEAMDNASKGRGSNSQTLTPHNEPKQMKKLY